MCPIRQQFCQSSGSGVEAVEVVTAGAAVVIAGAAVVIAEAAVVIDGAEVVIDGAAVVIDGAEVVIDGAAVGAEVGIAIPMVGYGMPTHGGRFLLMVILQHRGTAGVNTGLAGAARTGEAAQTFADA